MWPAPPVRGMLAGVTHLNAPPYSVKQNNVAYKPNNLAYKLDYLAYKPNNLPYKLN